MFYKTITHWAIQLTLWINIPIWISLFGKLNCALVLQRKLPSHVLSPHVCPICVDNMKNIQHLLIDYVFVSKCWFRLLQTFNICWDFLLNQGLFLFVLDLLPMIYDFVLDILFYRFAWFYICGFCFVLFFVFCFFF